MKRFLNYFAIATLFSIYLVSCSTVPVTGRHQLSLIPSSQMIGMSFQEYGKFLKTHKVSTNQKQTALIRKVGRKIQHAVEKYMADNHMSQELNGYKWEFNLIENNEANAWAMPGGKVVVYTGILPISKDENGIAVVMGHEISHAIAGHGRERMSQGLLAQLGGIGLAYALRNKPRQTQQLWMTAFGVGAQLGVLLPFSRVQESEADHLGLIFMSMAGYDPHAALNFWQRMAKAKGGKAPPEFLNTHPSDQTRINDIKKLLPEAMSYYRKSK